MRYPVISAILWMQFTLTLVGPMSGRSAASDQSSTRAAATEALPEVVEFNRDIRPLLSDNCFFCHGPDKNKRQADLRLDTEAGLLGHGDTAGTVVPGQPAASELFRRITSTAADEQMPPADSGKSLTPRDIRLIQRWIEQGGKFEGHWAFLPLRESPTETVDRDVAADSARIDELIAATLAEHQLPPSPEADRRTLIRRLSFDLIGLPPTITEVSDFVNDASPQSYERVVDRLLQSPHFGERLAMWWLDLVRYADTVGYHGDQEMSVSPYRQYVIDSFNTNKPFDQFTIEQIAGDLLPDPTTEQRIASGYNRLGMMSAEGGVQDKEYLAKYIAERVRNVSGTWLGITLGCAECHDHKFDPFTTRDFYRMEAFFADIRERGLYSGANSDGNWGPRIKIPTEQQAAELAELDRQIAAAQATLDLDTPELTAARAEWEASQIHWTLLKPETATSQEGATLTVKDDQSVLASDKSPATDTYVLSFRNLPPGITAIRLDALPDDSLPGKGSGRAKNGNFVLTEVTVTRGASGGEHQNVVLQNATATWEQTGAADGNPYNKWAAAAAIDRDEKGKQWGWAVMEQSGKPQAAVFETDCDLTLNAEEVLTVTLNQHHDNPRHTLGRFRLAVATAARPVRATASAPDNIAAILAVSAEQRSDAQKNELAAHFRSIAPQLEPTRQTLTSLRKQRETLDGTIVTSLITEAVPPRMIRVLPRGNWMDDSGEVVTPAFPAFLTAAPAEDRPLTRLDLARWIVSDDNPLTARVVVNRLWKVYFGSGLSRKLDDLGAQGEWPSHPHLLDHLAGRLIHSGWDLKRLIKSIVMSRSYRQSSAVSTLLREQDPGNRWLARQGRFRLDAELVRDNALSISGLLVPELGGTSVHPYQPPGYWAYLNFPQREWKNSSGESLYRRGLYTHWQRQYLHPSLLAFDAPCREECTADRPRSNTPLQSLVLLNDPSYVEAARAFAELIMRHDAPSIAQKLEFAFQRALSRPVTAEETAVLEELMQAHLTEYTADPAAAAALLSVGERPIPEDLDKAALAAWTSVARTILNLHEVITRN